MKKIILLNLILFSVLFLVGCQNKNQTKINSQKKVNFKNNSYQEENIQGITALEAWKKIEPQAKKWSRNFKVAKISDISYASFQRKGGLATGWEFYLENCQKMNTTLNICSQGKTKVFRYSTVKGGWGRAGVSSEKESAMVSGRTTFSIDKIKIDSAKAVQLASQKINQPSNKGEEFILELTATDEGDPYWSVRRQCWFKSKNREVCNKKDNYSLRVNAETGEINNQK